MLPFLPNPFIILPPEFLYPIFFLIALLYAMAGFGGGSSYLAVLALTALPTGELRVMALVCNIIVAGGGVFHFARAGAIPWRRALPLVLCSVPAAYLGGRIDLPREQFMGLLGIVLLLAGLAMWWRKNARSGEDPVPAGSAITPTSKVVTAAGLGAGLGFLAGVVSIGGGIFLSPVLFLQRWAAARAIAAVTSLFILVNSLAGLAGQFSRSVTVDWSLLGWLSLMVLLGGQLGTRLTIRRLSPVAIRRIAALLIIAVGLRLLVQVTGML